MAHTLILTKLDIARLRLRSQWIAKPKVKSSHEVVTWMGAMQAQDFEGVKWAIGLRMAKATEDNIEDAYNSGEILRTHILRPTWHIVAREDLVWMLELTASNIKTRYLSRERSLGLTRSIIKQSEKVILRRLENKESSTREELISELNSHGILTDLNRASHLLAATELDGLICSGPIQDGKITYALLEKRISKIVHLAKEEALAALAKRYFLSCSPATLEDFKWWSGLSLKDARIGIETIKEKFKSIEINGKQYWVSKSENSIDELHDIHLLPAFDEFVISYANRTASLPYSKKVKAVSNNGIFHPTVELDGQVIGIWVPIDKPDSIKLNISLFDNSLLLKENKYEKSVLKLSKFKNQPIEILFTQKE